MGAANPICHTPAYRPPKVGHGGGFENNGDGECSAHGGRDAFFCRSLQGQRRLTSPLGSRQSRFAHQKMPVALRKSFERLCLAPL